MVLLVAIQPRLCSRFQVIIDFLLPNLVLGYVAYSLRFLVQNQGKLWTGGMYIVGAAATIGAKSP